MTQQDEFAQKRRELIIEALSWWEDADGRWGYEKARETLEAHEAEWCERDDALADVIAELHDTYAGAAKHLEGKRDNNGKRAAYLRVVVDLRNALRETTTTALATARAAVHTTTKEVI